MTSYAPQSLEMAKRVAYEKGQRVVLPGPCELFLDIDRQEDLELMTQILGIIGKQMAYETSIYPSPSGEHGHYHVIVTLDRAVSPLERICLQAILGSDRKREAISWGRHQQGEDNVTRFFQKLETT